MVCGRRGGHRQRGRSPSVWGRGVLPRQGREAGPVPPHQAGSARGGAARPETGCGALGLPGPRPVPEAREQRAEKQPQACLHACLPDEAAAQEPGRLGNRWGERKRQAAQEGATQGKWERGGVGCVSKRPLAGGEVWSVGRGPRRTRLSLASLGKPGVAKRRGDLEGKVVGGRTSRTLGSFIHSLK